MSRVLGATLSDDPEAIQARHEKNLSRLLEATLEAMPGDKEQVIGIVTGIYRETRKGVDAHAKGWLGYSPLYTARAARERVLQTFPGIKLPTGAKYRFE